MLPPGQTPVEGARAETLPCGVLGVRQIALLTRAKEAKRRVPDLL